MDGGVVPPCLELGEGPEHTLLRQMSEKANRRGVVPASFDTWKREPLFMHLITMGYIERIDCEAIRFKVLEGCPGHETISVEVSPRDHAEGRARVILLAERGGLHEPQKQFGSLLVVEGGGPSRPRTRTPLPGVRLARDLFPQLLQEHRIDDRYQSNWRALCRDINIWAGTKGKSGHGYSFEFIEQLMHEFVKHPEWCRSSRAEPWKVFLTRRQDLVNILLTRKKRDPANRRWRPNGELRGRDYWLGHTPRASSPA